MKSSAPGGSNSGAGSSGSPKDRIAAVVLAAGQSNRMGANKQLLALGGEPLVRRTVRQVLAADFGAVLVVLGRDAGEVRGALAGLATSFTVNPRFGEGLATSFRAGLDALSPDVAAAAFVLADMPLVTSEMYRAVQDTYRSSGAPLVLARFGGVRAPPHLFHRSLFARFGDAGDHGPRDLVREHQGEAAWLDFPAWALTDVDTPADLARARALAARLDAGRKG